MARKKVVAVGRPRTNYEQMPARFPAGTMKRIDKVLEPDETRARFVREAVIKEFQRREIGDRQAG